MALDVRRAEIEQGAEVREKEAMKFKFIGTWLVNDKSIIGRVVKHFGNLGGDEERRATRYMCFVELEEGHSRRRAFSIRFDILESTVLDSATSAPLVPSCKSLKATSILRHAREGGVTRYDSVPDMLASTATAISVSIESTIML